MVKLKRAPNWSKEEDGYLKEFGSLLKDDELSEELYDNFGIKRTPLAVATERKKLGIKKQSQTASATPGAIEYVKRNFTKSIDELVYECIHTFKCKPTPHYISRLKTEGSHEFQNKIEAQKRERRKEPRQLCEEELNQLRKDKRILFADSEYASQKDRETFELWESEKISTNEARERISDNNMCPVTVEEFLTEAFSLGYFRKQDRVKIKAKPLTNEVKL